MKELKYIYILFITISMLLLSCGPAMEEKADAVAKSDSSYSNVSVEEEAKAEIDNFSTDTLDNMQKELFGKRAIQKLEDYYNYLEIISNTTYDPILRNHAKKLSDELFIEKGSNIIATIDSTDQSNYKTRILINNITISTMPKPINDSIYRGEMTFDEQKGNEKKIRCIGFIIKKTSKSFGDEKGLVWETYLDK